MRLPSHPCLVSDLNFTLCTVSLPLGLIGFPVTGLTSVLQQKFSLKWVIIGGYVLAIIGTILLPFANTKERYWPLVLPGMLLGSSGITIAYATVK